MTNVKTVGVYRPVDFEIFIESAPETNPFSMDLRAQASGPAGEQLNLRGFYKGNGVYCVRFSPTSVGDWTLNTIAEWEPLTGHIWHVCAIANGNPNVRGVLQLDPARPRHFRYEDGTPFFLMGYELNWLWALGQGDGKTEEIKFLVDGIADAGFTYTLVNAYAFDTRWCPGKYNEYDYGPPALTAWEGPHGDHDYSRLNTAYWDHFDRMMEVLYERGIVAHIYFKVYNKEVKWPAPGTPEDDLYFDYIVARYQAYPNLVWDYSKESYYETDKEYMADRIRRIRKWDAYRHLVTVHDDKQFSFGKPWNGLIDYVTDQNHFDHYYYILNEWAGFAGPIVNAEYAYEHGPVPSPERTWGQRHSVQENVARAYEVVMAGAYIVHYYNDHAWDVVHWNERSAALPAYARLKRFLIEHDWRDMHPEPLLGRHETRVMINDTRVAMILFTRKDHVGLTNLEASLFPSIWFGYFMDICTGEKLEVELEFRSTGHLFRHPNLFGSTPVVGFFHRKS
jgi:hypothetical protein